LGFAAGSGFGVVVEAEEIRVGLDEGLGAEGGEAVTAAEVVEGHLAAGALEPAGDFFQIGVGLLIEGFEDGELVVAVPAGEGDGAGGGGCGDFGGPLGIGVRGVLGEVGVVGGVGEVEDEGEAMGVIGEMEVGVEGVGVGGAFGLVRGEEERGFLAEGEGDFFFEFPVLEGGEGGGPEGLGTPNVQR
jgi:hypothetical protein